MVSSRLLVLGALALSLTAAPPALAQTREDPRVLTRDAKTAFDSGDFPTAVRLLERAYAIKPWPVLLYNLGRAYQQAGDKAHAIDAYERYLRAEPQSPDAGGVRESIRKLGEQLAREKALEAQASEAKVRAQAERQRALAEIERAERDEAAAEQRARHKASPWPWVVVSGGLGAVVAGVVFGGLALGTRQTAAADSSVTTAENDLATARAYATVANVLFVAGGTVAIAGAVWGIFDLRLAISRRARLAIGPATLSLGGEF